MRTTVKAKLDDVVDRVSKYVFAEIDPAALLTVDNGVPRAVVSLDLDSQTIKNQYRQEIRQEVVSVKSSFLDQYGEIVAAAAGDDDHASRREAFLEHDIFLDGYAGSDPAAFRSDLETYFDDVVETVEPVLTNEVAADGGSPGFWDAVSATYSLEEAEQQLETIARPRDLLQRHEEDLELVMDLTDTTAPLDELDHTSETVRTVSEAIDHVVEVEEQKLASAFDAAS